MLAFVAVYVLWGSTYLGIRIAIETMSPLRMAGVRFLISGAILLAIAHARGTPAPTRREWASMGVLGTLFFLGGNGGVVLASGQLPSGLISVLVAVTPVFIALLARGQERLEPGSALGLVLGLVGVYVLVVPGPGGALAGGAGGVGVALVLGASFSWAVGTLLSRRLPVPRDALVSTGGQMLAGGAVLLVAGVIVEGVRLEPISLRSGLAFAYLIVFGSLIGFTAYTWLLQVVRPVVVGTYAYVNPVVALLIGSLLGGERMTIRIAVGAGIVLASVVMLSLARVRRRTGVATASD